MSVSPEEPRPTRDAIVEAMRALDHDCGWQDLSWTDFADAVLSVPVIRRALAITAAIDGANEWGGEHGREIEGDYVYYADQAISRLLASGEPT